MKVIAIKSVNARVRKVKKLMKSAGNLIGVIWFTKRSTGERRKMSYRLHVTKPTYAMVPTGKNFRKRRSQDTNNNLITVFDTNTIRYNNKQRICGRGEWKSIPLDGVTRIAVNGEIYKIIS